MNMPEIIRLAGGASKLAAAVKRHHTTVLGWTRVPPEHVRVVSTLIGKTAHDLRPDLWEPSDAIPATERETAGAT
jgi:hypothetical protein